MKSSTYASTRTSRPNAAQAASPDDVMPASTSIPLSVMKPGPPESPEQVWDGSGWNVNLRSSYSAMVVHPVCLIPEEGTSPAVDPKPTRRTGIPTNEASKGVRLIGQ